MADDPTPLQLDYAWKWFSYAASQRMSLFNYFLLSIGIFATAYANLLSERPMAAGWIALIAAFVTVFFWLLDRRNCELVARGERVLRRLEPRVFDDLREMAGVPLTAQEIRDAFPHFDGLLLKDADVKVRARESTLRHRHLLGGVQLAALLGFGVAAAHAFSEASPTAPASAGRERLLLVIDAGSSGTRPFLYHVSDAGTRAPYVEPATLPRSCPREVGGGLQRLAGMPTEEIRRKLGPIADCARAAARIFAAPLETHVLATAGVREMGNDTARSDLLARTKEALAGAGVVHQPRTISGDEEARYAWVAVNDARPRGAEELVGILELGGASAQIAFLPGQAAPGASLAEVAKSLTASSSPGCGNDTVWRHVRNRTRACFPTDCSEEHCSSTATGGAMGSFDLCAKEILAFLNEADSEHCSLSRLRSSAPRQGTFVALASYFYTARGLGLPNEESKLQSVEALRREGRRYCATNWAEITKTSKEEAGHLAGRCFSAAYAFTLLTEAYGFEPQEARIAFVGEIGGQDPAWTRGAALLLATEGGGQ
jgi:hypothetical protein